jgi:NADH-quinone oxidoreductase subunit M
MLGAAYMLRLTQKMAWGKPSTARSWKDLNGRELVYLTPLAALAIWLGLAPGLVLQSIDPSIGKLLTTFQAKVAQAAAVDKTAMLPSGLALAARTALAEQSAPFVAVER